MALTLLTTTVAHPFAACLQHTLPPTTPLVLPSHPHYTPASQCLNSRSDLQSSPSAVVRVQSVADVQGVVVCARDHGVEISVRSGSHSFENHSCRGGLILDVSDLLDFSYDETTQLATWGSGHTNGQLYWKLSGLNRTLPLGAEGDVGSSGLVLGCGRGPVTQYIGRSCDRLVGVEFIDGQGNVQVANSAHNSDLLWVARGGGGEFPGVVSKFTALSAPEPPTVHIRSCDEPNALGKGKDVIREWARGLEEVSKSERKMTGYIHFFPNLGSIWVRYKCFDCNATQLAWFESKSSEIAAAAGGTCSPTSSHAAGGHPKQFINFLAAEPGVGSWTTLPHKAHYWPGDNTAIFRATATAGAYYSFSYGVNQAMLDALWQIIFNNPPASTAGDYSQQLYLYSLESDAVPPMDSVGHAYNGMSAKWIIHFKAAEGAWTEPEMMFYTRQISSTISSFLPCNGFYNYIEYDMPCAGTRQGMLAAYFSDPQRLQQIKTAYDPIGTFRNPLLSWVPPPPPLPPYPPPPPWPPGPPPAPPLAPTTCEDVLNNDADGSTCGSRIAWLQANLGLSESAARQKVAEEFSEECGPCAQAPPAAPASPSPPFIASPPPPPSPPPAMPASTSPPSPALTCEDVLENDAQGHTCGSRINWLESILGLSQAAARQQVAQEFQEECGACAQGPFPIPPSTTSPSPPLALTPPPPPSSQPSLMPPATTSPPSPPLTCEDVLVNVAEGHTCGSRIAWVQSNLGLSHPAARQKVAEEYPDECGPCAQASPASPPSGTSASPLPPLSSPPPPFLMPPVTTSPPSPPLTCEDVLENVAEGHTCGSRIAWVQSNLGLSEPAARQKVAEEYPDECGPCAQAPPTAPPSIS